LISKILNHFDTTSSGSIFSATDSSRAICHLNQVFTLGAISKLDMTRARYFTFSTISRNQENSYKSLNFPLTLFLMQISPSFLIS
jgi:hypothetical protein